MQNKHFIQDFPIFGDERCSAPFIPKNRISSLFPISIKKKQPSEKEGCLGSPAGALLSCLPIPSSEPKKIQPSPGEVDADDGYAGSQKALTY
jgi:hypothetical protein